MAALVPLGTKSGHDVGGSHQAEPVAIHDRLARSRVLVGRRRRLFFGVSAWVRRCNGRKMKAVVPDLKCPLIGIFGTPSALTYWGIHVVRTLVGVIKGEYQFVHGNYIGDLSAAREQGHDNAPVIFVSDCPEIAILDIFVESGRPLLIFVEEPMDVIADLMSTGGADGVNALRLATRSLCAIEPFLGTPEAVVFGGACHELAIPDLAGRLLAALRLDATDEQRREIERLLSPSHDDVAIPSVRDHILRHFPYVAERQNEVCGPSFATFRTVTLPYAGVIAGEALDKTTWPASIFSNGDRLGEPVAGPSSLIGPARILIYGPYMHLTRGDWRCYTEIEVADNDSGNRLKVDLVCGPTIESSIITDLPIEGRYCFSMPLTVRDPLDPIELRFQIESGAIEGQFLLDKVVMTRRSPEDRGAEDRGADAPLLGNEASAAQSRPRGEIEQPILT